MVLKGCYADVRRHEKTSLPVRQALRIMKLTAFLLLFLGLTAAATGKAQGINLQLKGARIEKLFSEISRQSGYEFLYTTQALQGAKTVDISVKDATLAEVLRICFTNQPFTYTIIGKTIIIKPRPVEKGMDDPLPDIAPPIDVSGRVVNEKGEPLGGATVTVKETGKVVITDANGEYSLTGIAEKATLEISYVGYEKITIKVNSSKVPFQTQLILLSNELDAVIMQAYGVTTKRLNTGNISKVSKEEIEKQPVNNPLATLEGRVPGMEVVQSTGVPGGSIKVLIRGNTSIGAGTASPLFPVSNEPLFIIDGIPYAPNNSSQTGIRTTAAFGETGGLSPFVNINPLDIESIEVLKDADATAIYGSRGANGVILITTKKGQAGKTQVKLRMGTGFDRNGRGMKLLNTTQYLQIRNEAFANDGVTPNATNAPDLVVFEPSKYTDYRKLLLDAPASSSNVQVAVTGGNRNNQFLLSAGFDRRNTVYSADPSGQPFRNSRVSINANFNHLSHNDKLNIFFSTAYSLYQGRLTATDPGKTPSLFSPNHPDFFDSAGNLVWEYNGLPLANPFANLYQQYKSNPDNFITNGRISYKILPGLIIKSSFGYNFYQLDEKYLLPRKGENPTFSNYKNSSELSSSKIKTLILEPQLEYSRATGKINWNFLLGATWQRNTSTNQVQGGLDFISDDLLEYIRAADPTTVYINNKFSDYKYIAGFFRINFNYSNKYLLNFSGRRDGSSRFGPNKQFASFGAIGAAWIFSKEYFASNLPWLSFGKIRASYGTTGNDKIGDYKFLNSWSAGNSYQTGGGGLTPTALFNPDFSWEVNRKLETGIDIGFLKDRILVSGAWYRGRCASQLLLYKLPSQTGFTSVIQNFPALIQNQGWELELTATTIKNKNVTWKTSFNISRNRNKLIAFPDLSLSVFATTLVIGESLSAIRGFNLLGVDPATGIYTFEDRNGDNLINVQDQIIIGDMAPEFFGGLRNEINVKRIGFSVFLSFKKQEARNYLSAYSLPGLGLYNPPAYILGKYWQKPGDHAELQKLTQNGGSPVVQANSRLINSNGIWSDASYIRIKNIELSYKLPTPWLKKIQLEEINLFVQAQNLFTITNYKGNDPENAGSFNTLPPLKSVNAGISMNF